MFDPKKIFDLMKNAGEMQKNIQEKLKSQKAHGSAGGDMVKVLMNGSFEIESIEIDDSLLSDKAFLQDLVKSAVNHASTQLRESMVDYLKSFTSGFGL